MRLFLAILLILATSFTAGSASADEGWTMDIKAGIARAKMENKDLLVDFSGSDWCHWCQVLDAEVFSTSQFKSSAAKNFVLVELDFPNDTSRIPAAIQAQNDAWSRKLQISGFPTVVLMDSMGRPYATTGYREGGATAYLAHLEKLTDLRNERDELFAKAAKSKGVAKAKLLDEALEVVGPTFAMTSYLDTIQQIIKFDPNNEGGVRQKYEPTMRRQLIVNQIEKIMTGFDPRKADKYAATINDIETTFQPKGTLRRELRGLLAQVLIIGGKSAEAVIVADEFVSDEKIDASNRAQWQIVRATALAASNQTPAALKQLDAIMANNPDNSDLIATCKAQKAQALVRAGRAKDAVKMLDKELADESNPEVRAYLTEIQQQVQIEIQTAGTVKTASQQ